MGATFKALAYAVIYIYTRTYYTHIYICIHGAFTNQGSFLVCLDIPITACWGVFIGVLLLMEIMETSILAYKGT